MVRKAALIALLLLGHVADAFAQNRDPVAIITEIYGDASPSGHFQKPLAIFADRALRERYLSKRLQEALGEMDRRPQAEEAPNLNFDVVSDSQDPDVHDLKISTESESEGEAVIIADFASHDEPERSTLRYEFVREEDGAWKIDDVSSSGKNHWRVMELIAGE